MSLQNIAKAFSVVALWFGLATSGFADDLAKPADLRLVPFPKEVRCDTGVFKLNGPLRIEAPADQAPLLGGLLGAELQRAGLARPEVAPVAGNRQVLYLIVPKTQARPECSLRKEGTDEDYALRVTPDGVAIEGRAPAGLLHGVQTLVQLVRANRQENRLPCISISDWPSMRWRCFQNDMTRGPSATLPTLKDQIALGSLFKMNLFTYYMEHQFAFGKHAAIAPKDGSMTPEELRTLVEYARPLGLEIIGSQQSFGHMAAVLKLDHYAHLREGSSVLTPVKEETYQLLDELYADVCPLTPFSFFNVNCDETWDLGKGPSKELVAQIGIGKVYAQHMRRVHDLLAKKYNKRMMMWGDIILKHPDCLGEIPKDTIMLSWGYEGAASFEAKIIPFKEAGYEFFVCPGISDWNRILPDFQRAEINIRNYVRDGLKHGAIGMLNTEWKDNGENLNAVNWQGYAWGAECAWNGAATESADFNRRLGGVLFGEKGDHFGQAIGLLSQIPRLPWMEKVYGSGVLDIRLFWDKDLPLKKSPAALREQANQLLPPIRTAIGHLQACQAEAVANTQQLDALIFGARRIELLAQRWLDAAEIVELYNKASAGPLTEAEPLLKQAEDLLHRNGKAHAEMGRQFSALFLAENRPYALDWTTKRYAGRVAQYELLANRLAEIRQAAIAGKPLPTPESLGLALPLEKKDAEKKPAN